MMHEIIHRYIPEDAKVKLLNRSASFEVPASQIQTLAHELSNHKHLSLKCITATDEREQNGCFKIWYVFGVPKENALIIPYIELKDTEDFPSITAIIHQASGYEMRIRTFFGLIPVGHLDDRMLILHENWPENIFPLRKDFDGRMRPKDAHGTYAFQKVEGEGIYEIPVGPVHAGIIEPGHFRFSVAGESIVLLEPRLGYVHKGSEKLFETLSLDDKIRLSEKISGDSSLSHSLAFCQALEQLGDVAVPARALYLRVIFAELERLANHFGDIGAMMLDTGFNFGGAHGARLHEMIMRINERLTGSRFLRGVNVIGGVTKNIDDAERKKLSIELHALEKDFFEVIAIAENSTSLLNRLKGTGTLDHAIAKDNGIMGMAGRASGIYTDVRHDFPYAAYASLDFHTVSSESRGDVYARFHVRIKEVSTSMQLIQKALHELPVGDIQSHVKNILFKKNAVSVSLVEGWRGEIVYFVTTDAAGNISRVAPRDPSFVNWNAMPAAGFDNVVPDFPLINKSFNMSYSGNDL